MKNAGCEKVLLSSSAELVFSLLWELKSKWAQDILCWCCKVNKAPKCKVVKGLFRKQQLTDLCFTSTIQNAFFFRWSMQRSFCYKKIETKWVKLNFFFNPFNISSHSLRVTNFHLWFQQKYYTTFFSVLTRPKIISIKQSLIQYHFIHFLF